MGIEGNAARYVATGSRVWVIVKDTKVQRERKMSALTSGMGLVSVG
jgi:hypothetical protein